MLAHADEAKDPLFFSQEGVIEFQNPRVVAELNFTIANLISHEPGEYRLQVYGNDQLLGERRLFVMEMANRPPGSAHFLPTTAPRTAAQPCIEGSESPFRPYRSNCDQHFEPDSFKDTPTNVILD